MTDINTFSKRSNAKRAAEKAIRDGSAPSIDYRLHAQAAGRFEIVWVQNDCIHGTREVPTTEQIESEIADNHVDKEAVATAINFDPPDGWVSKDGQTFDANVGAWEVLADSEEKGDSDEIAAAPAESITNGEGDMPDIFPPGARVIVQTGKRKKRTGAVEYRVDSTSCRVKFDGPHPSILCRYNQLTLDDGSAPIKVPAKAERKPRAAPSGDRKPSRSAELDARAATGAMPTKPIMTSPTNREQYQKRFDQLEKWAMAGDWDAVQKYEVKGINSYAKMVKQYRARLLAAHAASAERSSEAT